MYGKGLILRYTNWYVITGAPCSGKTSVILALADLGYRVVHEAARAYIEEELKKGRRLQNLKADPLVFERRILYRKIDTESALPEDEIIFLDRAIPDSIAYYHVEGLDPAEPEEKSRLFRYKKVFLFERLVFETDPVRSEDDLLAESLDRHLESGYRGLGYDVLRVPVLPVQDRTRLIIEHL